MRPILFVMNLFFLFFCSTSMLQADEKNHNQKLYEEYALSEDRQEVLKKLLPGTEIYYFLHTLYYQQTQQAEQAEATLMQWLKLFPDSKKYQEMRFRQDLIKLGNGSEEALQSLIKYIKPDFDYQHPEYIAPENDPSELTTFEEDIKKRFAQAAVAEYPQRLLTSQGLFRIADKTLDAKSLYNLLRDYRYPDLPNLEELLLKDFHTNSNRSFGDLAIHRQLTQKQLEGLKEKKPELMNSEVFVEQYLKRVSPLASKDLEDPNQRKDYFERLYQTAKGLAPKFNSLKANLLHQYLKATLTLGKPDFERFHEYLSLPRIASYASDLWKYKDSSELLDYTKKYQLLELPFMGNDDSLVKEYLYRLIQAQQPLEKVSAYFKEEYLKKAEAEYKITLGLAKPETFLERLSVSQIETLKNETILTFLPENTENYRTDDLVKLHMRLKNCAELGISIYRINALDYYRNIGSTITPSIDLDTYIPNLTKTLHYPQASHISHDEVIELPELKEPGAYLAELSSNGIKAKALIYKGRLYPLITYGIKNIQLQLFDDQQKPITDFQVYFGKRQFNSTKEGMVFIPYANKGSDGRKNIAFLANGISHLHQFYHRNNIYTLSQALLNHKESLIPGQTAKLMLKLTLQQNLTTVSQTLLKEAIVEINILDLTKEPIAKLRMLLDLTKEIQELEVPIPEQAESLTLETSAKVGTSTTAESESLFANSTFEIAGAQSERDIKELYLRKEGQSYSIECLNKAGLPMASVPISVALTHQSFTDTLRYRLQTDKNGRIQLHELKQITKITASFDLNKQTRLSQEDGGFDSDSSELKESLQYIWLLQKPYTVRPEKIIVATGDVLTLPLQLRAASLNEEVFFAQIQQNSQRRTFQADLTAQLKLEKESLIIPTNQPGAYQLILKSEGYQIQIHVLEAKKHKGYLVSKETIARQTEYLQQQMEVAPIQQGDTVMKGKIKNYHAKVHVFCLPSRFYGQTTSLVENEFLSPSATLFVDSNDWEVKNRYLDTIQIPKESRYITLRKQAQKYPGNNLLTPSSILNPYVYSDYTEENDLALKQLNSGAGGGGAFGSRMGGGKTSRKQSFQYSSDAKNRYSAHISFLRNSNVQELTVEKDGSFEVDLNTLNDAHLLELVVLSSEGFLIKEVGLPERKLQLIERRQLKSAGNNGNQLPFLSMETLKPNSTATFQLSYERKYVLIDTFSKLFEAFSTLYHTSDLNEFYFLTKWHQLTEQKKLAYYKNYACHELHFFIYRKDKPFFEKYLKPYLKNKQNKSLVDKYILEEDLTAYTEFSVFTSLNIFEKILLVKKKLIPMEVLEKHLTIPVEYDSKERKYIYLKKLDLLLNGEASKMPILGAGDSTGITYPDGDFGEDWAPSTPSKKANNENDGYADRNADVDKNELVELKLEEENANENDLKNQNNELKNDQNMYSEDDTYKFYEELEDTKIFTESGYYMNEEIGGYHPPYTANAFWLDYLHHGEGAFLSRHIFDFRDDHSAILALALIDLPAESETQIKLNEETLTVDSKTAGLVILRSNKTAELKTGLVNLQQHYFYYTQDGKKALDPSKDKFLVNKHYATLIIATNISPEPQEFFVNHLIPEGAIPIGHTGKDEFTSMYLKPFGTSTLQNNFYFPAAGSFQHLPAKLVSDDVILSNNPSYTLTVTDEVTEAKQTPWELAIREGNPDKILAVLKENPYQYHSLFETYFLLKNKDYYAALIQYLKSQYIFKPNVWAYSLYHKDLENLKVYLKATTSSKLGPYFESSLISVDTTTQHSSFIEFSPLILARTHSSPELYAIEFKELEDAYKGFINKLLYKHKRNSSDYLNLIIYKLYKNEISEAFKFFEKIDGSKIEEQLQYNYLKAYLALYKADLKTANAVLEKYKDIEIPQWQEFFKELKIQLMEISTNQIDGKARGSDYSATALASKETLIKASRQEEGILISYANLEELQVDYYLTNLEALFSRLPFEVHMTSFYFITAPNASEKLKLNQKQNNVVLKIPDTLKNKNLMIKISGNGKEAVITYYPNRMDISLFENYGQLRVLEKKTEKPLSAVYIKVYGKTKENDDHFSFVKDGYTDLRGIFNYTQATGVRIDRFVKLAVLVISEEFGAEVLYVAPPTQ